MQLTVDEQRGTELVPWAWAAIGGGVLTAVLGIPLASLQASSPIPTWILALNAVSHLLFLAAIVGLARSGAAGRSPLAPVGIGLALLGLGVMTLAEVVAMVRPTSADVFYGTATLIVTVGLVLTGVAVLRAGRWGGWRTFTPLVCGLFLPLVVVPAFTLPGYAPHHALGLWGACWVLLGLALLRPTGADDLGTMDQPW